MSKLVCGVGINDADYVIRKYETTGYINGKRRQKYVWRCPFYTVWASMLERGYCDKCKTRQPTYKDITVFNEWHLFSNFKSWMETQDYVGKSLDKDLLVRGNKVYSPETCVFVSGQVNTFLLDRGNARGAYKIGVCWYSRVGKFVASCRNPITKKKDHLGYYTTEQEAHEAWLAKKLEHAYTLAAIQTDERVARMLIERYINYNEVTK